MLDDPMGEPKASIDELFRVVLIDKKRKQKLSISLKDNKGDDVPIREAIENITEYIEDKLKEEGKPNVYQNQIVPLMAQSMVGGMCKLLGESQAAYVLSHELLRQSLIAMMTVGFTLLKWIQKKDIHIHTVTEDIMEEDLEMYTRMSTATDLSIQGAAQGLPSEEIIKELLRQGRLKLSDLEAMGYSKDMISEELAQAASEGTVKN